MEYDGSIKFSIEADDAKAKDALESLKNYAKDSEIGEEEAHKIDVLSTKYEEASSKVKKYSEELLKAQDYVSELQRLQKLDEDSGYLDAETEAYRNSLIREQLDLIEKVGISYDKQVNNLNKISIDSDKLLDSLKGSEQSSHQLAKGTEKVSYAMNRASTGAKSMGDSIGSGVKKVTRYALALFGIRSIYTMLSRLSREWLNSNDVAAKQMQANVQALSNGLSQILAPVLQTIMGWATMLMGYVNALTKAFFGVELFTAKTNKNLGKATGNAKKLGKEVKNFTASFDEADVASENIADNLDSGAGGAGGMDLPQPSIPTPDISGIMGALSKVKEYWQSIWNSDVMQAFMNLISAIIVNSMQSAISIAGNLWGNLVELWYAALPNLTRGFQAMLEYWTNVFNDMAEVINTWSPVITESINGMVDRLFNTFTPFFVWLAGAWADIGEGMVYIWNKHGKAILSGVGEFINNLILLAQSIWDNIIHPILEPAIEHLAWFWDNYLKDILLSAVEVVFQLTRLAIDIVNNVVMPIVTSLMKLLKPVFETVMNFIVAVTRISFTIFGNIAKVTIGVVIALLNGLIKFINSDFAKGFVGGFQWAIDKVANLFNLLARLVKVPLNTMINMVNALIKGFNLIRFPGWVPGLGGKGINIPTIPYLAKGGVLNRPTLNVAGEAGREAVVPLENNTGWAKDFLGVLDQYGGLGGNNQPTVVQIQLDRRTIAEAVIDELDEQKLTNNRGGLAWNM